MCYDGIAKYYDRILSPFERRFLAKWRRELLNEIPPDTQTIEIGAGTGLNFPYYNFSRGSVASDYSSAMLEIAKEREAAPALAQADAQHLPFKTNQFGAAFATLVFCSVSDPKAAFSELVRVTSPGAPLVFLEHVRPKGLLGRLFDVVNVLTVALMEDHFNRRTADLASESGLEIIDVRERIGGVVNLIICRNPKS